MPTKFMKNFLGEKFIESAFFVAIANQYEAACVLQKIKQQKTVPQKMFLIMNEISNVIKFFLFKTNIFFIIKESKVTIEDLFS